jgi:outer membrane immunogenic protein
MKKLVPLAAAVAAFGFINAAHAADLPVKAPAYNAPPPVALYNWSGFYVGLNGGWGWGKTSGDGIPLGVGGGGFLDNFDIDGGMLGGQIGFNYQMGNVVLGIEADWDWANIGGSVTGPPFSGTAKVKDIGTVRGRVGYAWDRFLVYGTAGWAWSSRMTASAAPGLVPPDDSHSLNGYAVGGGLEYGITPNLSLKAEYLHAHLSPTDFFRSNAPPCPGPCDVGSNVNVVRLGLNWRF